MSVYSLMEVAALLKLSRRTIYSHIKRGTLKAMKVGGTWRVSKDNLQAFMSGQ